MIFSLVANFGDQSLLGLVSILPHTTAQPSLYIIFSFNVLPSNLLAKHVTGVVEYRSLTDLVHQMSLRIHSVESINYWENLFN